MMSVVKKIKISVVSLLSALIMYSCGGDKTPNLYKIKGKLSNSDNEWVMVYRLTPDAAIKLDSAQMDDEGTFSIEIHTVDSPELFLLKVKNYPERVTLLMNTGEEVVITGDALYLNKTYDVTGSEGSEELHRLTYGLNKAMENADSVYFAFRADRDTTDIKRRAAHTDSLLMDNYRKTYEFVRKFCFDNSDNLAGIIGLYSKYGTETVLNPEVDFDVFETVAKHTAEKLPDNLHVANINESVDKLSALRNHKKEIEKTLQAGNKAPDFILRNPEGKAVELSSYKGKYLALYFWISTKKDCWDTNEKLKEIYKKYKNKDFDILWVSMEKDKLVWVNTIALNRLNRENVLADESVYDAYNLDENPRLFLIDKEGVIIGKDISADSLETALKAEFE